jgi:beta-galactosidase
MLAEHVRALDPTRPITSAICFVDGPWVTTDAVFAALDVGGYNYQYKQYRSDHERVPERLMCGLESTPGEAFDTWLSVEELPYVIGDFVWTSLDYLGEAGIGRSLNDDEKNWSLGEYPWHQANCGDLDLCGFKRPQSYYRDVLWGRGAPLYIAVHTPPAAGKTATLTYWGWPEVWPNWTWPDSEGQAFVVDVYSACDEVELRLNGRSLGRRPSSRQERCTATFEVPYEAGILQAVGYRAGQPVATCEVRTAGPAACLRLTPDRSAIQAVADDLSYVTVEVLDGEGQVHPLAAHNVQFSVSGPGVLAGVGSGNPVSTESYHGAERQVYRGRCLVVVKAGAEPGEIRLRAQAPGLEPAEVVIWAG